MQANQPQGSTAEATTTPLAVGDKVSYVAISGGARNKQTSKIKVTAKGRHYIWLAFNGRPGV